MQFSGTYPYLPLWLITVLFFLALLLARELGAFVRRRHTARMTHATARPTAPDRAEAGIDPDSSDGFAMTSVLGLLALLIGFTFSLSLGRHDERRQLVVKEANALGTTWLRTDLLAPQDAAKARQVLRRYIDARVDFGSAADAEAEVRHYARATALQSELWRTMTAAVAGFGDTPRASLVISTTNEAIDRAAERYAARQDHIPPRILRMLCLFALLSAGLVGYERAHQRKTTALLLLLFSLAVGLVMDLDLPGAGATRVPQEPMLDLQRSVHAVAPVMAAD